jgi:hypothetical protein
MEGGITPLSISEKQTEIRIYVLTKWGNAEKIEPPGGGVMNNFG